MSASSVSAAERAEVLLQAWVDKRWITEPCRYPSAPKDIPELYDTHLHMQRHVLASSLGGHGGYKIGAKGALGETCIYAPLFSDFFVDEPAADLSSGSYQLHQVEPEFGLELSSDLPAPADGSAHTAESVWQAVESVVLCIECCGRRGSAELTAAQEPLGKFADFLMAGAVVRGLRLPASSVAPASLNSCEVSLQANGVEICSGAGAECPGGGPAEALAWLANHANERGLALHKGQLVITGATCITRDIKVGDRITAVFQGLGTVEAELKP